MAINFRETSEFSVFTIRMMNLVDFIRCIFQGCYNLVKAGADGVIQAMVLSFGSFRFSKQHLEFNMHPSFLHRTYHFR